MFWLGCCDARVQPAAICGAPPGEIFVHTNIANQARAGCTAFTAALAYAAEVLGVAHVIICGHTQCGGVAAAMQGAAGAPKETQTWLQPLQQNYAEWRAAAGAVPQGDEAARAFSAFNVRRQVEAAAQFPPLQKLWQQSGGGPQLHGWLFNVQTGLLAEVCRRNPKGEIELAGPR